MADVTFDPPVDADGSDSSALVMMLTYIEAECRRMGNEPAARHAAVAAALVVGRRPPAESLNAPRRRPAAPAPVN
jgi:hypothetical protein